MGTEELRTFFVYILQCNRLGIGTVDLRTSVVYIISQCNRLGIGTVDLRTSVYTYMSYRYSLQ